MIRLPDRDLPPETAARLARLQDEVDALPEYSERVAEAKRAFSRHNTTRDPTFQMVRRALGEMCSGAVRCCYCEDSCADEVEHIRPKDLYPEAVFSWPNYLYACGPCNGPKSNRFAVFPAGGGDPVDVTRKQGAPVEPPLQGDPVLIDPRHEDPLSFLELQLQAPFALLPAYGLTRRASHRADYTIRVLGLNRDLLLAAREEAYYDYRARLIEYCDRKAYADPTIPHLLTHIQRKGHPTVWREMKRQYRAIPELHALFEACPEALHW